MDGGAKCSVCGITDPKPDHRCASEDMAKAVLAGEKTPKEIADAITRQALDRNWPSGAARDEVTNQARSRVATQTARRLVLALILGTTSATLLATLHWAQSLLLILVIIIAAILWETRQGA